MKSAAWAAPLIAVACWIAGSTFVIAEDWPQFRGPDRDARATGFEPPAAWPEMLTRKWQVFVGDGVASPALADGKLYIYTRQGGDEVIRCLDAESGEQIWEKRSAAAAVSGAAGGFPGPRSTPTVADGKVILLGVEGVLSCYDAANGDQLWQVTEYRNNVPRFSTSSSPIAVDGLCIAQLGGDRSGVMAAYDLTSGKEVWQLSGAGPAYGSPVLMTIGSLKALVAPTDNKMIAVSPSDGKLLWAIPYTQGRYNAATPLVDGNTLVFAGPTRGLTAVQLVPEGDKLAAKDVWRNEQSSVQFNTPVIREHLLFGLSNLNSLFCLDGRTGEMKWNAPLDGPAQAREDEPQAREDEPQATRPQADEPRRPGQRGGGRTGGGRPDGARPDGARPGGARRGGGGGGYGTVVDAGSVIVALPESGQLIVFEPTTDQFSPVARYTVASGGTYGYPILSGHRIYVKDRDSITLWTLP